MFLLEFTTLINRLRKEIRYISLNIKMITPKNNFDIYFARLCKKPYKNITVFIPCSNQSYIILN